MIGKLKFFPLLFVPIFIIGPIWSIELHLKITDLEGLVLSAVKQGEPFLIEITVLGEDSPGEPTLGEPTLGEPTLTHMHELASCQRYPVATHISIINGQQQMRRRYLYKARIDTRGQFALGPAYFDLGNRVVQSEALSFMVDKSNGAVALNQAPTDPFILVKTNKPSAYVGEQVMLSVRVCYKKPVESLALEPFTSTHAVVQQLGGPVQETFSYDGHTWGSLVYNFLLYPQQEGELVIPGMQAQGTREKESGNGGFFAHFFASFEREKIRATAQPNVLRVKALPKSAQQVQAVGEFTAFSATLDKKILDLSTAATLTLTLVGNGNMMQISFDQLNVPAVFKRYDAKKTVALDAQKPGFLVLHQEIVLQPLEAGTFVLAPIVFSFFNPKTGEVTQLKTAPVSLNVKKDVIPKSLESAQDHGAYKKRSWPKIPVYLLMGISTLLLLALITHYLVIRYRVLIAKKIIFYKFRRLIKRAHADRNAKLIYRAWFDLFAQCMGEQHAPRSLYEVEHLVRDDLRLNWRMYIVRLEKYAFELEELPVDLSDLIEQTIDWLDEFGGLL